MIRSRSSCIALICRAVVVILGFLGSVVLLLGSDLGGSFLMGSVLAGGAFPLGKGFSGSLVGGFIVFF